MILPQGSAITYNSTLLYVSDVTYSFVSEPFDRIEFSNERLRQAKDLDGAVPVYMQLFGGVPAQVLTTCSADRNARPLGPDDDNIDQIKRRMDIKRYTIKGLPNTAGAVTGLYTLAKTHKILFDHFQLHLAMAQMDISYDKLIDMQSEDFSYLTAGGATLSHLNSSQENCIEADQTFMLVRDFVAEIDREVPGASNSTTIYKSFTLVLDNITIKAMSDS